MSPIGTDKQTQSLPQFTEDPADSGAGDSADADEPSGVHSRPVQAGSEQPAGDGPCDDREGVPYRDESVADELDDAGRSAQWQADHRSHNLR
jgi:hypothetical protein